MLTLDDTMDWDKGNGLVPAIVQDAGTGSVLMLGYMNRAALAATLATQHVTFWSRQRARLWTKGESSGNVLELVDVKPDCDHDALLVSARPRGPTCHLGTTTCFGEPDRSTTRLGFLATLDGLVEQRSRDRPVGSYTTALLERGLAPIAQKVGEEAVETALAAVTRDDEGLIDESADLLFHLIVLLRARGLGLDQVSERLRIRHAAATP